MFLPVFFCLLIATYFSISYHCHIRQLIDRQLQGLRTWRLLQSCYQFRFGSQVISIEASRWSTEIAGLKLI